MDYLTLKVSEEILLREAQEKDSEALFQAIEKSRPRLKEWMNWLDTTQGAEDTLKFIKSQRKSNSEKTGLTYLIIKDETIAGVVGFNQIDNTNKYGVVGYWMSEDFVGKGILTSSLKKILEVAFTKLELNSIQIAAAPENKRSCAVPKRLGFKLDGIIRQREWLYDHFVDHAIYTLLKSEWQAES